MERCCKSDTRNTHRNKNPPCISFVRPAHTPVPLTPWSPRGPFPHERWWTIFWEVRLPGKMSIGRKRTARVALTMRPILCKYKFDRRMSPCLSFTNASNAVINGTRNNQAFLRLKSTRYLFAYRLRRKHMKEVSIHSTSELLLSGLK